MTVDVTARHMELSDDVKQHVTEKLTKLERLVDGLDVHATLSAEKHRKTCHLVARGKGLQLTSESTNDDLFVAIHEAIDSLGRQLRKTKTSILSDRREGADTIRRPGNGGSDEPRV
jgi:putative sigma-54 modulation protein